MNLPRTDPSGFPSCITDLESMDGNQDEADDCRPLTFHGVILRSHLVMLLKKKVCYAENTSVSRSNPGFYYNSV